MIWQNLLHGDCPRCGSKLEAIQDHTIVYECTNREGGCEFFVTQSKMLRIISDDKHPMRAHLTESERQKLDELGL